MQLDSKSNFPADQFLWGTVVTCDHLICFNDISLQIFFHCRIAKERVHLTYKHPELLLDLMKKGTISTSLACNDLEVNIRECHDKRGDICVARDNRGIYRLL